MPSQPIHFLTVIFISNVSRMIFFSQTADAGLDVILNSTTVHNIYKRLRHTNLSIISPRDLQTLAISDHKLVPLCSVGRGAFVVHHLFRCCKLLYPHGQMVHALQYVYFCCITTTEPYLTPSKICSRMCDVI